MALIKCPECNKEISDAAKHCPQCGYELKSKINLNKVVVLFIIVLVIAAIFLIVMNNNSSNDIKIDIKTEKADESNSNVKVTAEETTKSTPQSTTTTIKTTKTYKLSKGEYVNKKSKFNGGYLDSFTLSSKNSIERGICVENGGCIDERGTYKINNNILSYKLTETCHLGWEIDGQKISNAKTIKCEIIKDNTFKCDSITYTLMK